MHHRHMPGETKQGITLQPIKTAKQCAPPRFSRGWSADGVVHAKSKTGGVLFALFLINFVWLAHPASGTPLWASILAPSRAADWSKAGVNGGIPNRTTQCGTTIAPYGTASTPVSPSTINIAIQSCPAGQVVILSAGSFYLNSGITFNNKNGVTLRGAGPDQTFLYFSGADPCGGEWADICFEDDLHGWTGNPIDQPGGQNAAIWSAGYSSGTTQITLTNVGTSGIQVGNYIILDQANDTVDNAGFLVCDNTAYPCSLEAGSPGRTIAGVDYNQQQIVQVTAINGSQYSITPGLYAQNWSGSKNPGAWWSDNIQNSGVENLSLDHSNSNDISGIAFFNAFNCWVYNVRSINSNRNHVWFVQSAHNTVESSYFYGVTHTGPQGYGVESYMGSDNLVVNNIIQRNQAPIMMGPSAGSVYAYNYGIDMFNGDGETVMSPMIWGGHDAGDMYNLFEGNVGNGINSDIFHGTVGALTIFRNYFTGWETGKSLLTMPIDLWSLDRYSNILGNVLGTVGYHTVYQDYPTTIADSPDVYGIPQTAIYAFGYGDVEGAITVPSDPLTFTTSMRWGNYDVVNNAVQWDASEVPSGLSQYANPVPATQTLPPSFFLKTKPSWWGTVPWPAIGPEVTGGTGPGGHAYSIPAQQCYVNSPIDPNYPGAADRGVLLFNADTCYGNSNAYPSITSPLTASGSVGSALTYQITATNNPTSFDASPLPAGLSVNTSSGLISGTPTSASTTSVTLSATNDAGVGTATLVVTIASADSAPVITSALTASGTAGSAFNYQITATNNPTSFDASPLPAGLSVDTSSGLISGKPTSAGTTSVTLSATNSNGVGNADLVITISASSGGGGAFGFLSLCLLGLALVRKQCKY